MVNTLKKPLVSVIVPVYNSGDYLYRCMDSLVYQSFDEIEIIAVNNESTDNSLEILKKYEHDFPEKVKIINIPHAERAGTGRNIGMNHACADYIVFSDSDDMMHPRAIEWLYGEAIKGNFDFVYAPFVRIKEGTVSVMRKKQYSILNITNEQALRDAEPSPWAKIFRKELLEQSGGFPESLSYEDLAFFYCYVGLAKRIGYCKYPVYYYFWRKNSEVHTLINPRIAETVDAERYGLEHCTSSVKQELVLNIANRIRNNMSERWIYADRFLEHLNNLWPTISSNSLVYRDAKLFECLAKYYTYSENQTAKNIFVDGFDTDELPEEYLNYLEKSCFYDDGVVIHVLNEKNCDVGVLPSIKKAYERKNYNYVAAYFALHKIYELGGTYIGRNIFIDLPLNFTRHLNSYFGYKGIDSYNDQIFGGRSKQEIFRYILELYQKDTSTSNASLADYISQVLKFRFNIRTGGRSNIYGTEISIFSPDVYSVPITPDTYRANKVHFSHYTRTAYPFNAEDAQEYWLPRECFDWLFMTGIYSSPVISRGNQRDSIELKEIKSSRSWKIIQRLKRKKDKGIWKIFYHIYLLACEKLMRG